MKKQILRVIILDNSYLKSNYLIFISLMIALNNCDMLKSKSKEQSINSNNNHIKELIMENQSPNLPAITYTVLQQAQDNAVSPKKRDVVQVHYTGWLQDGDAEDMLGEKFDSSVDRNAPFQFVAGAQQVIAGWDRTILDMKTGEKRRVVIPAEYAYGPIGAGDVIPPHATLIFDIELLDVKPGVQHKIIKPSENDNAQLAKPGSKVALEYTLWLEDADQEDKKGQKLDSNKEQGEPFEFIIGSGQTLPGIETSIPGMKVGETKLLYIPYYLAYGDQGIPGAIPSKTNLVFEVTLLKAE